VKRSHGNLQLLLLILCCSVAAKAERPCQFTTAKVRRRLETYVQKKLDVQVKDISFDYACVEKNGEHLTEVSIAGTTISDFVVFIGRDGRYLTTERYDIWQDPEKEIVAMRRSTSSNLSGGFPVYGADSAPIHVVEFVDFQCPFCGKFALVLHRVALANPNQVEVSYRSFPLVVHPWARRAAEAAACIALQDQASFADYYDYVFQHQSEITFGSFPEVVDRFVSLHHQLDLVRYRDCVESGTGRRSVDNDVALGEQLEVDSTPTTFVNGKKISGATSEEVLSSIIQEMLGQNASLQKNRR